MFDTARGGGLGSLLEKIGPARAALATHPLYESIGSIEDIRFFMEQHVFAVWDFVCLLKGMQQLITCVEVPWRPVGKARTRRLINEIVLEEESDLIDGVATGHFEFYLEAMEEIGASTSVIRSFLRLIEDGYAVDRALAIAGVPAPAARFVGSTFATLETSKPHVVAASFTFGREDSIPSMFRNLLPVAARNDSAKILSAYLERHLLLDEEDHGPKAVEMVCDLCEEDPVRWQEASASAAFAIEARLEFWTGVLAELTARREAAAQGSREAILAAG